MPTYRAYHGWHWHWWCTHSFCAVIACRWPAISDLKPGLPYSRYLRVSCYEISSGILLWNIFGIFGIAKSFSYSCAQVARGRVWLQSGSQRTGGALLLFAVHVSVQPGENLIRIFRWQSLTQVCMRTFILSHTPVFMNAHDLHVINLSKTAKKHRAALKFSFMFYFLLFCFLEGMNIPWVLGNTGLV